MTNRFQKYAPPDEPAQGGGQANRFARYAPNPAEARPTAPRRIQSSQDLPARQETVRDDRPPETGNWLIDTARSVGDWITSDTNRQRGVGEAAYQSIPEQRDVHWQGGPLSGVLNSLPRGARTWLDAQGRANAVGLGLFLDANEAHRAQIIQRQVPDAEFRRDEYGNLQVRYGQQQPWAYLNRPGLSAEDAQTFANEGMKYYLASKVPGLRGPAAGVTSPLMTSTLREGARGGLSTLAGQSLATIVGGPGPDGGDVGMSAAGAMAGNVIGHTVGTVTRAAPRVVGAVGQWLSDVLPGGAQRAAERTASREAAAQMAQDIAENVARRHAEATVRAAAEARNLQGRALEQAIQDASEEASQQVRAQFAPSTGPGQAARELEELAQSFAVRLSRAQTEGDEQGVRYLFEAAGGVHGPLAQREATAFIQSQYDALPGVLRSVVGGGEAVGPADAIGSVRRGMGARRDVSNDAVEQAWSAYNDVKTRGRTYQTGVRTVLDRIQQMMSADNQPINLPEFDRLYPQASGLVRLVGQMAEATPESVPMRDVDRVISIQRASDAAYERATSDAERRLITRIRGEANDWLTAASSQGGVLTRRAPLTAARLREALAVSQRHFQAFANNPLIRDMLPRSPGSEAAGRPPTDAEIVQRLFGGGESGLNFQGQDVEALRLIRDAVGVSSPEWQNIRRAAMERLGSGLDLALENHQTPPVLTVLRRIDAALQNQREAMMILFSPDELRRLAQAQRVLRAVAPPSRNPINPSGSGLVAIAGARGILAQIAQMMRSVPGPNIVFGVGRDLYGAAQTAAETSGAASPTANIARAIGDIWNVRQSIATPSGAIGSSTATLNAQEARAEDGGPAH